MDDMWRWLSCLQRQQVSLCVKLESGQVMMSQVFQVFIPLQRHQNTTPDKSSELENGEVSWSFVLEEENRKLILKNSNKSKTVQ